EGAKSPPAAGRPCDAGGRGQAQRQAQDRADREIAKGLRFERIPVPADGFYHPHRRAEPPPERLHQRRVVSPAAAYQPFAGGRREMSSRSRDAGSRHLGQGSGPVSQRKSLGCDFSEIVSIERFRRRALEEGGGEKPPDARAW